jgi:hypothetical protein
VCSPCGAEYEDVSVAARQLVGREEELEAVLALLDVRERLPGAVVLAGEAGKHSSGSDGARMP